MAIEVRGCLAEDGMSHFPTAPHYPEGGGGARIDLGMFPPVYEHTWLCMQTYKTAHLG